MPPNANGRNNWAAAGCVFFDTGERLQHNIAENGHPIAALIAALELAAISCRPMHIEGRAPVQVRRLADGYALGLRP